MGRYLFVTQHAKRGLMGITKSIDRGQPCAYCPQADHGRYFPLLADFLCIFAAPILSVGTACRTNKIRGKILRKCLRKKKDKIRAKKHPGMQEIAPFFSIFFPESLPLQRSLAPSKLNIAAPIEIR